MEAAFGIDLGTTYSAIGFLSDIRSVEVVDDGNGEKSIPSYISYSVNQIVCGTVARGQRFLNLSGTIYDTKRLIGRRFSEIEAEVPRHQWPFQVTRDAYDRILIKIPKDQPEFVEPWQVSSELLKHLIYVGNRRFPSPGLKAAVITVPAYFNDGQRAATRKAAEEAGIEVLRIFNEPTAAALAVRWLRQDLSLGIVLIFDFGGGTLDVSLLRVEENQLTVLATSGDTQLGGRDIDERLVAWACDEFRRNNPGATIDDGGLERIREKCKRAKETLSSSPKVSIIVPNLIQAKKMNLTLTRAKLNELCEDLFQKCFVPVDDALRIAQLQPNQINQIILVGGSASIPRVQELLRNHFPESKVHSGVDRRQAVVMGAAVLAAKLKGYEALRELVVRDVCPLTIGMRIQGGIMCPIIKRSTRLPVIGITDTLYTARNFQESLPINIFEGEYKLTKNNHLLAHYLVTGIPRAPAFAQKVQLTFSVTEDGILTVSATCDWEKSGPRAIPMTQNPWHYTSDELAQIVSIDPAARLRDEAEADELTRAFHRKKLLENLKSFFKDAEENQTDFAQATSSNDRKTVMRAAQRLSTSPSKREFKQFQIFFRQTFQSFYNARPSEFPAWCSF